MILREDLNGRRGHAQFLPIHLSHKFGPLEDLPDWYRRRTYAHFDLPLGVRAAKTLALSPDAVSRHGFFPIIVFPKRVYRRKSGDDGRRIWTTKVRPLGYVAHSDAQIHSRYAAELSRQMELRYSTSPANESVIAYRKLNRRCNIDFAVECFDHIRERGECDVVALDVRGFFDHLDHHYLKRQWCSVLGVQTLPDDVYAVLKSVTRDRGISLPKLRDLLGGSVPRRIGATGQRICEPKVFRDTVVPHLEPRHEIVSRMKGDESCGWRGIPQGTPISAVLANLYMYEVDVAIASQISEMDGYYRRYSDDLVVVTRPNMGWKAEAIVSEQIAVAGLQVQDQKTERCTFRFDGARLHCERSDGHATLHVPAKLQYLGFSFDGEEIAIRDATVAAYIDRMRRYVRRARYAAQRRGEKKIRKRQLLARLSELGWGSAYGTWCDTEGPPRSLPRMGFHRYLKLAAKRSQSATVQRQGRQLSNLLHRVIAKEQERLASPAP